LTDEQIVALFNYTQEGIKSLTPSDTKQEDTGDTSNKQAVQAKAQ
jgi:uncharacterized protein with GYD domain